MGKPILINGAASPVDTHDIVSGAAARTHRAGTPGYLSCGRVFYWCISSTSATAAAGKTMSTAAIVANHQNLATTTTAWSVGQTVIPAGTITLGATALTENQYADGWLCVVDGQGEGTYYQIREHDAGTSAGTDFTIVLYDAIRVASDASTEVTFHKNTYTDPVLSAVTDIDTVLGVPNVAVTTGATTAVGFWVQSQGLCPCFVDGTPAVGQEMVRSVSVQGNMGAQDIVETTATLDVAPVLGNMATVGINGEVQLVNLKIRGL
jgi:hypothetical protein